MKKRTPPINLQLFADTVADSDAGGSSSGDAANQSCNFGDTDSGGKDNDGNSQSTDSKNESSDSGSQNRKDKQSSKDDEISRLKKQLEDKEKVHQENIKKEVEKALKEQKRLSKLSEEERKKEEQEKRIKELEQREKAVAFKEKFSDVKDELVKRNLPTIFADYLVDDDNEKSLEKIAEFEKTFQEAVKKEVDDKIKGVNLKSGNSGSKTSLGKDMAQRINELNKKSTINPWA